MPQNKRTYGRRPRAPVLFAASASFNWSSPAKPSPTKSLPNKASMQSHPSESVAEVSIAFSKLEICQGSEVDAQEDEGRRRRVLGSRDVNAIIASPRREEVGKTKERHAFKDLKGLENIPQTPGEATDTTTKGRMIQKSKHSKRVDEDTIEIAIPHVSENQQNDPENITIKPLSLHTSPEKPLLKPKPRPAKRRTRKANEPIPAAVPDDPLTTYSKPILDLCSDPHGRTRPTPFSEWASTLTPHFTVTKIAEATYGEVYRLSLTSPRGAFTAADESVLKIIALKPPTPSSPPLPSGSSPKTRNASRKIPTNPPPNTDAMSSVSGVASEVRLLRRMTRVPGFTNFREVRVLVGRPEATFVAAWRAFNARQPRGKKSAFPDPGRKASYGEEQLWAVIEMQDAGTDLESVAVCGNGEGDGDGPSEGDERLERVSEGVWGIWDVFWGVAIALGKGEEEARFEHRDLHLGNICIRSHTHPLVRSLASTISRSELRSRILDPSRKLGFTKLETTIIDYTLSRADMRHKAEPGTRRRPRAVATSAAKLHRGSADAMIEDEEPDAEDGVAFLDLEADPALFEGDGGEDYQYDIYRFMRASHHLGAPLAAPTKADTPVVCHTANDADLSRGSMPPATRSWREYNPQSNLIWLHFILVKFLDQLSPGRPSFPTSPESDQPLSGDDSPSSVVHDHHQNKHQDHDCKAIKKRAASLLSILETVQEELDLRRLSKGHDEQDGPALQSAAELVAWAVGMGWLDVQDVVRCAS